MEHNRSFTREPVGRFEWERILRRIQVSAPSVKLVGLTMATYADATGRRVRPGQARLAAVMGTSISTVRRGQTELEQLGMLEMVTKGRSFGRGYSSAITSEFRLTFPSDLLESIPMLDPDEQNNQSPMTGASDNYRSPMTPTSEEVPVISEELPVIWAEAPVTHEHPPQHEHHIKDHNTSQSAAIASQDQEAADFKDWYSVYPKHVGRGAAVKAYAKARKAGATADELVQGARGYAATRKGQDPQYTKAPATWLNQECWADEYPEVPEIDVEALLGRDMWTPGQPPDGLTIPEEVQWKKDQRAAHQAERLEQAKAKAAQTPRQNVPQQYAWAN